MVSFTYFYVFFPSMTTTIDDRTMGIKLKHFFYKLIRSSNHGYKVKILSINPYDHQIMGVKINNIFYRPIPSIPELTQIGIKSHIDVYKLKSQLKLIKRKNHVTKM